MTSPHVVNVCFASGLELKVERKKLKDGLGGWEESGVGWGGNVEIRKSGRDGWLAVGEVFRLQRAPCFSWGRPGSFYPDSIPPEFHENIFLAFVPRVSCN